MTFIVATNVDYPKADQLESRPLVRIKVFCKTLISDNFIRLFKKIIWLETSTLGKFQAQLSAK